MLEENAAQSSSLLERHLRFSRRVVILLLVAVLVLLAIGIVLSAGGPAGQVDLIRPELVRPIYLAEMVTGFLVIIVRRLLLSSFLLRAARQKGLQTVLRNLTIISLFGGLVAVPMALTGLVVCRLTADHQHLIRLGGMGLLLALYSLPRRGEWRSAVAGLE